MWKNTVERIATNPHSEYIILLDFPLQQRLQERASLLRYTCIACLFSDYVDFSLLSIIRPLFHTHICLNATLIGRKSGRRLETFNQGKDLSDMLQQ